MAYFRFKHIALLFVYLATGIGITRGMDTASAGSLNAFFNLPETEQGGQITAFLEKAPKESVLDARNPYDGKCKGDTIFHTIIRCKHPYWFNLYVIQYKQLLNVSNAQQDTPLDLILQSRFSSRAEATQLLLAGSRITRHTIEVVLEQGDASSIETILESRASFDDDLKGYIATPGWLLLECAYRGSYAGVKYALRNTDLHNINRADATTGYTALHFAIQAGGTPFIVQRLLDSGADPLITDKEGLTPLEQARHALKNNIEPSSMPKDLTIGEYYAPIIKALEAAIDDRIVIDRTSGASLPNQGKKTELKTSQIPDNNNAPLEPNKAHTDNSARAPRMIPVHNATARFIRSPWCVGAIACSLAVVMYTYWRHKKNKQDKQPLDDTLDTNTLEASAL